MMTDIKKILMIVLAVCMFTGCKENLSHSYLMQHPLVLKKEVTRCQSLVDKSSDQATQCASVMSAARDMMAIINEQQEDPEKFGQKILDTEAAYVNAKNDWRQAQQIVNKLKANNASPAELDPATEKLAQAQKFYENQSETMKTLLAVAGLSSPE